MLLILRAFDSAWIVDGATYSVFHQTLSGCRFTLRNGRDKLIFQISPHWVAWSSWGYHIFADLEITTRFWTVFRAPEEFELHLEICFRPTNLFLKKYFLRVFVVAEPWIWYHVIPVTWPQRAGDAEVSWSAMPTHCTPCRSRQNYLMCLILCAIDRTRVVDSPTYSVFSLTPSRCRFTTCLVRKIWYFRVFSCMKRDSGRVS